MCRGAEAARLSAEDRTRSSEDRKIAQEKIGRSEDRAREDRKIGGRSSEDRTRSSEDRKIAQEGPVRKHDTFKFVQGRSPTPLLLPLNILCVLVWVLIF